MLTATLLRDSRGKVVGTRATGTVPASLVAKSGTAFVNTLSPHSGAGTNGLSNSVAFLINPAGNPVPSISAMSPSCAGAGSAGFSLTVTGSNFVMDAVAAQASQVLWGAGVGGAQSTLTASVSSATQIQATVSSALIASAGTANVSVFNPPAAQAGSGHRGGGTSPTSVPFTITRTSWPAAAARTTAAVQAAAEETPPVSTEGRFYSYTSTHDQPSQVFVRD